MDLPPIDMSPQGRRDETSASGDVLGFNSVCFSDDAPELQCNSSQQGTCVPDGRHSGLLAGLAPKGTMSTSDESGR